MVDWKQKFKINIRIQLIVEKRIAYPDGAAGAPTLLAGAATGAGGLALGAAAAGGGLGLAAGLEDIVLKIQKQFKKP